jgi:hypothetical protein
MNTNIPLKLPAGKVDLFVKVWNEN